MPAALKSVPFLVVAGLSLLAAALLVALVVQSRKLGVRDQLLTNHANRSAQIEAGMDQLQARIAQGQADTAGLRQKLNEATQHAAELAATADKLAAASAGTQMLLEKARQAGTEFQTGQAAAQVAALEQQGKAEVAQTEAGVMRVQLQQATDVSGQLQRDLTAAKSEIATLQEQLQQAVALIASLQKPSVKR